jgi:hypothetical protein
VGEIRGVGVDCPAGIRRALAGGFFGSISETGANRPSGNSWFVIFHNDSSIVLDGLYVVVVCGRA